QRNNVNINDFLDKDKNKDVYQEKAVSMLGRINGNEPHIYEDLKDISKYKSAKKFKNKTYYIKRKSNYEDYIYYLLNNKTSGVDGVIGYVHSNDLCIHHNIYVDRDKKHYVITGHGLSVNVPWGRKASSVIDRLEDYEGIYSRVYESNIVSFSECYYVLNANL